MSTRASAPRCASCGMPLAPDAESCAVCGARVPLIARPATGEDETAADDEVTQRFTTGEVPSADPARDAPGAAVAAPPPAAAPPVATRLTAGPAPTRPGAFDGAAAARDVRAAARPARPAPVPDAGDLPSVGPRVLAYAVDVVVAGVAAGAGVLVVRLLDGGAAMLPALLGLLVAVAQVVAEGLTGATVGARVVGLRTVDERTGGAPGIPRAFVRQLLVGVGALACLVGNWVVAASAAWDSGPRRRGWHDKASGTTVVRAAGPAPQPTASRASRAPGAAAGRSGATPWTPTAPAGSAPAPAPARAQTPAAAPTAGPSLDDFLFAPPAPGGGAPSTSAPAPALPAWSAPTAEVRPPEPDLLPAAPQGPTAGPRAQHAEADLLPPPPGPGASASPVRRSPAPPAAPALDADLAELEHTRVRDPESLRRRSGTLALHFDTGERVRVVGRGLVGRGPRAEDGQDILHVVALNDAARSLSRVHAEFGPQPATTDEDAAIWLSDRGSTNGTVVIDPTGSARVLPSGARAVVRAGWTVRLGDREARVEDD